MTVSPELGGNNSDPETFRIGSKLTLLEPGDEVNEDGLLEVEEQLYIELTVAKQGP